MKNIHPIMAQALAPFAPKPDDQDVAGLLTHIRLLEVALQHYKAPVPDLGVYVYEWLHDAIDEPLVCHLEYFAPEAATDASPGQREGMALLNAFVRGCDVYGLLSSDDVYGIEIEALAYMKRVAEQDKEPT